MTREQKLNIIGKYLDEIKNKKDYKEMIKRLRSYEILVCINNNRKHECGIMDKKFPGLDKFMNSLVKEYGEFINRYDVILRRYNCPICGKELIRLEPFDEGEYRFWCDSCNLDIIIEDNNVKNKDDDSSENCISEEALFDTIDSMISNCKDTRKKSGMKEIRDTLEDIFVNSIYG